MKITMLPSDMDAPGCYRVLFPMRQMVEQGKHVCVMPPREDHPFPDGRTRIKFQIGLDPPNPFADLYLLQMRNERIWKEGGVQRLRSSGIITVADVDDNYVELPTYNPAFEGNHPYRLPQGTPVKGWDGLILPRKQRRELEKNVIKSKIPPSEHNRFNMHDTFRQVDHLTVSTPYLGELYSRYNPNVTVIRNFLDWDIWEHVQPQCQVERDRILVGYLGVFSYRQGDLDVIRDVVPEMLRRHPNVDFVANSDAVHDYMHVPTDRRVVIPEYAFRQRDDSKMLVGDKTAVMDIGLVPLTMNGLNQAKSHLKGMEYNAAGVPFIASPTESYRDYWCEEGDNGFLASNTKEWLFFLDHLICEEDERREMGRHGRAKAAANTYQEHWTQWEDLYLNLVGQTEERITRAAAARGAIQKVSEFSEFLRLLKDKPTKVIVEVGSAKGGTFWALARVADKEALLISIDIPAGSAPDRRHGKDIYGNRNRERLRGYANHDQKVVLIDANSQLSTTRDWLLNVLSGRQIDVLLIDADHTYKGVKRDYELYSPLVAPGGVIAFHDITHHQDRRIGVEKLWKELRGDKLEFVNPDETWGMSSWGGIGVIIKERDQVVSAS